MNDNFYEKLRNGFSNARENPFLSLPCGKSVTYSDMDAWSARMASLLRATGAKPGDRIVVQVDKSPENVALYFGAMRAGLVYVPLNTGYTAGEVEYFLHDAKPSVFVCDPGKEKSLAPIATATSADTLFTLAADGGGSLIEAVQKAGPSYEIHPRHRDDLAVILYTSGTTGRPKGAMLTHYNLASNAETLNALWGFAENDVLLHALPVFHIHGLFVALHTAILSAAEILFLPTFDIDEILRQMPRASVMMGVPTFYSRLLSAPEFDAAAADHMRLFISGSAPLTAQNFAAFEARTGHRILERYGMSEGGMIASNPLKGSRQAGTVGFALPDVDIRVADENDTPLPPEDTGEVQIKGPNIFKGYWNKPDQTQAAFTRDGYFHTGDLGTLDHEGRLTLVGRSKDLIIAGGYNIYPKEIEQVLDAVPGVSESAVIGVAHPDMGEGVIAILDAEGPQPGDETIENSLQALAKFKRPRRWFWIDALPRNTMGKVQKQRLREEFAATFLKPNS